ncbi:cilia- and flagella-associated protein 53 [Latimeria chalumnae]|uniref:cilia- and flagella-associated protein 53 n=1 Tax=Latimeria chalumnae TaxID=7897 RepID=UPI00313EA41A
MLVSQRNRHRVRVREFHGPTPHSFGVLAKKASEKPIDIELQLQRLREAADRKLLAFAKYRQNCEFKCEWEKMTDRRVVQGVIERRVHDSMQQYKMGLEERRQRLQDLLGAEEREYLKEMDSMKETTLERQAKMRERAKFLRENREQERLKVVAEKLDQQFREQCEEVKEMMTRRHQNEVCMERMAQLAIQEEARQQDREEQRLYVELWEKDRLAKEEREVKDVLKTIEQNREMVEGLDIQKAAAEAQRAEEKRLKEEEAKLMEEEMRLYKLELERAKLEKLQKQKKTRSLLDYSVKLKMKRLAQEEKEEMALEIKIMDELLKSQHDDTQEKQQRKVELREEMQRYRDYLAQQLEEQKRQEKEMERLVAADVEKAWAKKLEQWRKEKEARNRLLKEVMDTRFFQVKDKLARNLKEQEDLLKDAELLAQAIEEYKRLEEESLARKRLASKIYQQDLFAQMAYQQRVRDVQKEDERKEVQAGVDTETAYQLKLKEVLSRPYMDPKHIHPLRKPPVSSSKNWLPA